MEGIAKSLDAMDNAWGDAAGHVSYLIVAVSYWLTNIYWLRITAVVGLCFEVAYFIIMSDALYTGIAWDCVFIAINLFHLSLLTRDRLRLRSVKGDLGLLRAMFEGLDDAQIGRGTFVGEMAFLSEAPASATVTALQPCRDLSIEREKLKLLLLSDHQIAAVLHRVLGADLVQKLRARNAAAS